MVRTYCPHELVVVVVSKRVPFASRASLGKERRVASATKFHFWDLHGSMTGRHHQLGVGGRGKGPHHCLPAVLLTTPYLHRLYYSRSSVVGSWRPARLATSCHGAGFTVVTRQTRHDTSRPIAAQPEKLQGRHDSPFSARGSCPKKKWSFGRRSPQRK